MANLRGRSLIGSQQDDLDPIVPRGHRVLGRGFGVGVDGHARKAIGGQPAIFEQGPDPARAR